MAAGCSRGGGRAGPLDPMRATVRLNLGRVVVGLVALIAVLWPATGAAAHALRISSDPDDGSTLKVSPAEVSVTFSEEPDPALSALKVLDSSGASHQRGQATPVPGQPATLHVAVDHLADGVYTVTWRTVSHVDGHLAAGSFSFGVGVSPAGATTANAAVSSSPSPSATAVASRWVFYVGTMVLFGAAALRVLALTDTPRRLKWLLVAGWVVAVVGAAGITQAARSGAGVPLSRLIGSSLGHAFLLRAVPLAVVAVAVVVVLVTRRERRWPAIAVAVAAGAVMAGEVASTHAAASRSWHWFQVTAQWLHFASVSVWIGGLATLALVLPGLVASERAKAARRFSTVAGLALVLVVASGGQRALAEVGAWGRLTSTGFGRWVLLKIGVLGLLAALGAANRYRNVPRAGTSPRGLRRVGGAELGLAALALVATGFLQNLAPASVAAAAVAKPPPPLVVDGSDYGTSVRVHLTISPGTAGFNRFVAGVVDYDTRRPVVADKVSLRFSFPSRPDVGDSDLTLDRQPTGAYAAQGANLALDGRWDVTVLIERGTDSVEVPLTVTTRTPPRTITSVVTPGLPTIYTVHLSAGRAIQIYLDPGHPGLNQFHETFLAADGSEIQIDQATPQATLPGQTQPQPLTTRRLDPIGHFVSDVTGPAGRYHFDVSATANDGSQITAHIDIDVQ